MISKERVRLGPRSYDILTGPDVLSDAGEILKCFADRAALVTNRRVGKLYGHQLMAQLEKSGVRAQMMFLPDGEEYKTLATVEKIYDRLVKGRYDRGDMIVALGGGVTGDVAGFVAATYMRGVKVAQAPTTLLAQVDSSVGGKTGVNHPGGKNLIGAFYQPCVVLADVLTLKTLPRAETLCGVAEIIKYGCIASTRFFGFLEKNMSALIALEPDVTSYAVRTSCRIKADVVSEDERESGRRAILNFGHTVGHAIEAVTGYRRYRHGYAVAMGMRAGAILSQIKGGLKAKAVDRITGLIQAAGLPTTIPAFIEENSLLLAISHDKKTRAGKARFALLNGIGQCEICEDVTRKEISEAIRRSRHE